MNIAEVALNPGVAPGTHLRVEAELVHGGRVGFDECRQPQRRFGERAGILEAFRSVETDPAAAEEVIEQESALPHAAAIFILAEPDVLEAGEQARLQVIPTVDQFDIGLVNRWDHLQAGLLFSFKYIRFGEYENGGSMGQGAFLLDYLFSRGRIGFYGTEGFKNTGALTETPLGLTSFIETYARPMNQLGFNTQVGAWGDAWIQGNLGYIHSHSSTPNRPGGEIKLVQPFSKELAFTVRAGLNPTLLTDKNTDRKSTSLN